VFYGVFSLPAVAHTGGGLLPPRVHHDALERDGFAARFGKTDSALSVPVARSV